MFHTDCVVIRNDHLERPVKKTAKLHRRACCPGRLNRQKLGVEKGTQRIARTEPTRGDNSNNALGCVER